MDAHEECPGSCRSNFTLILQPCGEIEYLMFLLIAFIQPLFLSCFTLIPSNVQVSFWRVATRRRVGRRQSRCHFLIGMHPDVFYAMGILKTMFTGGMAYQQLKYELAFLCRMNHIPFLILLQTAKKEQNVGFVRSRLGNRCQDDGTAHKHAFLSLL